jgi:hypothetical protein
VSSVTRAEALSLYREILRTSRAFHWCDDKGRPWNKQLKENARKVSLVRGRERGGGGGSITARNKGANTAPRIIRTVLLPSLSLSLSLVCPQTQEFEESRGETDPLVIARLLVTGRDCVQQIQKKFSQADAQVMRRIGEERNRK